MLGARLGAEPERRARRCAYEVTGGNPLMLDSLALELVAQNAGVGAQAAELAERLVPDSLIRTVLLRLRACPEGAVPIAEALTILGEAPAAEVVELAGLEADRGEAGIEALEAAELIEADDAELRFTHPIIRSTIYEQISPRRRHRRHVRGGAAARRRAGEAPERIAPHLIAAGDVEVPGGAEILIEAGRRVYAIGRSRGDRPLPAARARARPRAERCAPRPCCNSEPRRSARSTEARSNTCRLAVDEARRAGAAPLRADGARARPAHRPRPGRRQPTRSRLAARREHAATASSS